MYFHEVMSVHGVIVNELSTQKAILWGFDFSKSTFRF